MRERYYNLFVPQRFSPNDETAAIRANMLIDISFGHRETVQKFATLHPEHAASFRRINNLSEQALAAEVATARSSSLLMTTLMLTGACNADCEICYTDRRLKPDALALDEMKSVVEQTHALGSQLLYVPGDGEPLLDPSFLDLVDHCAALGVRVIVFTNGILLSNDDACRAIWDMSSQEFLRRLAHYPVYIYHKLWSLDSSLLSEMMGISQDSYMWTTLDAGGRQYDVPLGIARLMEYFPPERVGIECVVERRNCIEVTEEIIPFVQSTGVKSYIEPIMHSGRCFGLHDFDCTNDQLATLGPWLSRQRCSRMGYKCTVQNDGKLSPGMAIKAELIELTGVPTVDWSIRTKEGVRDIFQMLHTIPDIVTARYRIDGCFCEELNIELAQAHACNMATICQD